MPSVNSQEYMIMTRKKFERILQYLESICVGCRSCEANWGSTASCPTGRDLFPILRYRGSFIVGTCHVRNNVLYEERARNSALRYQTAQFSVRQNIGVCSPTRL